MAGQGARHNTIMPIPPLQKHINNTDYTITIKTPRKEAGKNVPKSRADKRPYLASSRLSVFLMQGGGGITPFFRNPLMRLFNGSMHGARFW